MDENIIIADNAETALTELLYDEHYFEDVFNHRPSPFPLLVGTLNR